MQISSLRFSDLISPNRIIILTLPRSGSTLLTTCVNSVAGVRMEVEPLNHGRHGHHMKPRHDDMKCPPYLIFNHLPYLMNRYFSVEPLPDFLRGSNVKRGNVAAGFKIMSHQISGMPNSEEFWNLLRYYNVRIVRLYRHNIIKQITSDYIVTRTRQSVVYDGKQDAGTVKIRLPVNRLENDIKIIREHQSYIDRNVSKYGLNNLLVTYEDYEHNLSYISDVVMPYYIGRSVKVTARTKRQNPERLRDRLVNYRELVSELRRLNMESFIKDT